MLYKRRMRWLAILAGLAVLSVAFQYWRAGGFMNAPGHLLSPTFFKYETSGNTIEMISLHDGKREPYFRDDRYEHLGFPQVKDGIFVCAAWNVATRDYVVLRKQGNEVTELLTSREKISSPVVLANGKYIVYVGGTGLKAKLYLYSAVEKTAKAIYDKPFVWWQQVLSSPDGSVILTAADKNYEKAYRSVSGQITRLFPDGSAEELAKGSTPVWYEEGKSFFYYDNAGQRIMMFDLTARRAWVVASGTPIFDQLVVSPDKKYLAFNAGFRTFKGPGLDYRLIVMSVDGWVKKDVKTLGGISGYQYVSDWID